MCKILVMTGINETNRETAVQFAYDMSDRMSLANNDGLGYAAVAEDGSLFAERWHNNQEAFLERPVKENISDEMREEIKRLADEAVLAEYDGFLQKAELKNEKGGVLKYDKYGNEQLDKVVALTLHTRFATSGKQFFNTHPFINQGVSLIHNGVIRNHTKNDERISTCDSERILNLYLDNDVRNNPENIQEVGQGLQGYYASALIARNEQGVFIDVFKDSGARLGAVAIDKLGVVITTDPTDAIETANALGLKVFSQYAVKDQMMIRLDPYTGKSLGKYPFKEAETDWGKYSGGYSGYNGNYGGWRNDPPKPKTHKIKLTKSTHEWFKNNPDFVWDKELEGYRRISKVST